MSALPARKLAGREHAPYARESKGALPMRRAGVVTAFALGAALASLAACDEKILPGNDLGSYKVTGQAQTNTCGLASPDPWVFYVELSEDKSILYWSWLDGTPPLSSAYASTTPVQATMTQSQSDNVDATDAGPGPCTMQRDDTVAVTLGAGTPPSTFTGTVTYAFSVVSGANCGDQLSASGGQYQALPCSVTYNISATHK
jgi:hypothetical protein